MSGNDMQPLVAAEYQRVHAALASLTDADWDQPSLCEGWTVRHAIAHLTMPARYTPEQFHAELAAADYDLTTLSNRVADRDASLPAARLLADLASDTLAGHTTIEGGVIGALSHVVIHGLDATVPTGRGCAASENAIRTVLDFLTAQGVHRHFGTDIAGRRLEANDLAWTYGTGETVSGPAHVLVLALAGRTVAGLDLTAP